MEVMDRPTVLLLLGWVLLLGMNTAGLTVWLELYLHHTHTNHNNESPA
jgi:hypothetical protein